MLLFKAIYGLFQSYGTEEKPLLTTIRCSGTRKSRNYHHLKINFFLFKVPPHCLISSLAFCSMRLFNKPQSANCTGGITSVPHGICVSCACAQYDYDQSNGTANDLSYIVEKKNNNHLKNVTKLSLSVNNVI